MNQFYPGQSEPPDLTSEDWAHIRAGGSVERKFTGGKWIKTRKPAGANSPEYARMCARYGKATADQILKIKERWT